MFRTRIDIQALSLPPYRPFQPGRRPNRAFPDMPYPVQPTAVRSAATPPADSALVAPTAAEVLMDQAVRSACVWRSDALGCEQADGSHLTFGFVFAQRQGIHEAEPPPEMRSRARNALEVLATRIYRRGMTLEQRSRTERRETEHTDKRSVAMNARYVVSLTSPPNKIVLFQSHREANWLSGHDGFFASTRGDRWQISFEHEGTLEIAANEEMTVNWQCLHVPIDEMDKALAEECFKVLDSLKDSDHIASKPVARALARRWSLSLYDVLRKQPLPGIDGQALARIGEMYPSTLAGGSRLAQALRGNAPIPKPSRRGA